MNDKEIKDLVNDLNTAIADVGALLEQKQARFTELGINPEALEQALTGQSADREVREQVLQELGDLERNLSEQVSGIPAPPQGRPKDRLASVSWAI